MGPSSIAGIGTGRRRRMDGDETTRQARSTGARGPARARGVTGHLADTWPASIRELVGFVLFAVATVVDATGSGDDAASFLPLAFAICPAS